MTESPRRARHLLDPDDLRRHHVRSQGTSHSLSRVQRWVMSVLAVTTILHLAVGLVLAALVVDTARAGAQAGLCVMASFAGLLAVLTARAIHGKPLLSPWLGLAVVPGLVGALVIWGL